VVKKKRRRKLNCELNAEFKGEPDLRMKGEVGEVKGEIEAH
jgi:hypothetical protein